MFWCRSKTLEWLFLNHLVSYLNQFIGLHFKGDGYIGYILASVYEFGCVIGLLVLTSRHDMSHILDGQGGVLVLGVDPDNTVTQATHGQNSTSGEGCARDSRSAQKSVIKHEHFQPDRHADGHFITDMKETIR